MQFSFKNLCLTLFFDNDFFPFLSLFVNNHSLNLHSFFDISQWWHPRGGTARTKTWTDVNNDEEVGGRNLGGYHPPWPEDSFVDIAVNGKIITTYNQTEFMAWKAEMAYNEAFYLLMDDKDLVQGDEPVSLELGIRLRSESDPKGVGLGITHIYYA